METRKIGIACFIGGAIGVIVALLVAPMFWWLGLLSGMAAGFLTGYVAYDVQEIFQRVPDACRAAKNSTRNAFSATLKSIRFFFQRKLPRAGKWIIKPRPYLHFCLGFTALLSAIILVFALPSFVVADFLNFIEAVAFAFWILYIPLLTLIMAASVDIIAFGCSKIFKQKNYCINVSNNEIKFYTDNYDTISVNILTYRLIIRSFLTGTGHCLLNVGKFIFWLMPKYACIAVKYMFYGIAMGFYFAGKFAWHLFKMIHSEKRLLCGVDSAVGVAISFVCLYQQNLQIGAAIMIVACGGILGAALGIANWELVSKRLLRKYLPNIS